VEATQSRILLVDDQRSSLSAIEAALAPLGHRLVRATSGEDALVKLASQPIALIIMDQHMPGLDGLATLSLLRNYERAATIPVLMLSASSEPDAMAKAFSLGAVGYVRKPFETAVLRAQVVALLSLGQRFERQRSLLEREHNKQRELDRASSARDAVAAAMRARTEFLGMVSHELRTTLSAIMGWAELLRAKPDARDRNRRGIDIIFENALAQNRLVEDLLDDARIAAGKLSIASQPMDLAVSINAAIDTILPSAHDRRVQIAAALPPHGCPMMGDAQRLQQVTWNLLSNAVKFSPEGGRVEVRLERLRDSAVLQVRDFGRGIPRTLQPFVFDRFRQAHSDSARGSGLGLGLAIARHVVELHSGHIGVDSDGAGHGTVFTVTLPLPPQVQDAGVPMEIVEPEMSQRATDQLLTIPAVPEEKVRLDGLHALVVDDQAATRQLISEVLTDAGATVAACHSVPSAASLMSRERFDIVLSDLRLGVIGRTVPSIALSAYGGVEERDQALEAGYQTFVAKPFHPASLVALIARLTQRV
jgi:signal transduction histidine kinase